VEVGITERVELVPGVVIAGKVFEELYVRKKKMKTDVSLLRL
jgi:hypothetical protein